ncbi:MAG TPA: ABC transporter permease [Candidatus Elarobacter sp.]|jgi:NitT/TauT family transport system permease protein|nr:ABC transporter permease [Candidatus Elarobacter sp.]
MIETKLSDDAVATIADPDEPTAPASRKIPNVAISIGSVVILLVVWTLLANAPFVKPGYLPSPLLLIQTFVGLCKDGYSGHPLWEHIEISLFRMAAGFVLGVIVGIPLGLLTGYSPRIGAAISPIMAFVRPIPPIAFIPMAVLYFGLGELGKIVLIFFVSFNYVQGNAQAGAAHVPIAYLRAGQSLGLSASQIFFRIIIPNALPQIFTGLKIALALSWAVVVAAELVGAQTGLGYMISNAALLFQIPIVYVGVGLIGLLGLIMNLILNGIEAKIVHWKGRG